MTDIYPDRTARNNLREAQLLILAFIFIFVSSLAVGFAPGVRTGEWHLSISSFEHILVLPVWALGTFAVVKTARTKLPNRDPYTIPIGALLSGWGLVAIWRITPTFGLRQSGWFLLASALIVVLFQAPSDLRWLRHYRYLWLGGGLFLLALTLFFGTNPLGGHPKLWLGCCGVYLQPSEPLRLLLIAFLASYFADRLVFSEADERPTFLQTVIPLVVVWSVSVLLLFAQRDLGTGSLFILLLAILLFIASGRWLILLAAGVMTLLGATLAYVSLDVVQGRIDAWLNPWIDPTGGSYQIVQSLIAFASGGIFGSGVGLGEPGLVPAAHTDFIYAVIGEEWGLLGTMGMLMLYALLVVRGIKIAARAANRFDKLLAAGVSVTFGLQSILIIAGVSRLLPLTGITLPFVSYGGSSLVTSFVALGLLTQISNKATPVLEPSKPLRVIQIGLYTAWLGIGLVLVWWSVFRAPSLTGRTDNLRTILRESYYHRGTIYDSEGRVLAESIGDPGEVERIYPFGEAISIVGYNSPRFGKSGIERSMDSVLHGESGHDALPLAWSTLLRGHPPSGLDVTLTLDADLQKRSTALLDDEIGAVVLLDAQTGELRLLNTYPQYDPNSLALDWDRLINDDRAPLLNRPTQAQYQPGMAIVPFLIAWGEDQGQFRLDDVSVRAFSTVLLDDEEFSCARLPSPILTKTLENALKFGCPGAFTTIASDLGYSSLMEMYEAFGFTEDISIRVATANAAELNEEPPPDELELIGIGQGQLVLSPIQMAKAFAAIASDGRMPPLRLIRSVRGPDGRWEPLEPLDRESTVISPRVAQRVMNASQLFRDGVRGFSLNAYTGPSGQTSAWFMGTDPDGHVLVIFLEQGSISQAENLAQALFEYIHATPSP